MMKIEVTLSSEYGIMFLYDAQVTPTFPAEVGKDPVMWTPTCLAFSVLSYVDGHTKITLRDNVGEHEYIEYFDGELQCPSKAISLYDHNGFAFVSVPLRDNFARISLRLSEPRNPEFVICVIDNLETF